MTHKVISEHGQNNAFWYQLNPGQQYRLKCRVWEQQGAASGVCRGSVEFNAGDVQQQFVQGGGLEAALKGVALAFAETRWFDIHTTPHSQRDMQLELRLQALNGACLGETFFRSINKASSASFNVMLAYVEEA